VEDRTRRIELTIKYALMTRKKNGRVTPCFPTAPRIVKILKSRHRITIGARQVLRDLREAGIKSKARRKHPALKNTKLRLAFAKQWHRRCPKKIVFSDEHFISTNDHTCPRMFVRFGDLPLPRDMRRRQNVPNFQVWGAIGYNWRSPLVFFPKNEDDNPKRGWRLNSSRYVERCLSEPAVLAKLTATGTIFQQDNARPHTANVTKAFFAAKNIRAMANFPASSPDFNPIEPVWGVLNEYIAEEMPSTSAQLKRAAIRAWKKIPAATINKYVEGFKKCVAKSVKNNGF
jgi:hypothetical protein